MLSGKLKPWTPLVHNDVGRVDPRSVHLPQAVGQDLVCPLADRIVVLPDNGQDPEKHHLHPRRCDVMVVVLAGQQALADLRGDGDEAEHKVSQQRNVRTRQGLNDVEGHVHACRVVVIQRAADLLQELLLCHDMGRKLVQEMQRANSLLVVDLRGVV